MKKVLVLFVVASLSFWGCSENSSITEPNDGQSNQSFLKINTSDVSELSIEAKSALGIDEVNTLNKSFSDKKISQLISAEEDDVIRFSLADKGVLSIGTLEIKGGSFVKDTKVKIAMASKEAALDFAPNVEFNDNNPALLTVVITGVDVPEDDYENIKFVYFEGNKEVLVDYDEIIVGKGFVSVVNAQLKHFSRFGFTK